MDKSQNFEIGSVLIIATLGMFVLSVTIIVFYILYQRRLYRQQEEMRAAEARYQKELLRASEQSREKEQQRMAQELHDGVGAMLSTTRMYMQQVQRLAGTEQSTEFAQRADKLLGETLVSVRRIAQDLQPVVLETLGLTEALKTLAEKVTGSGTVRVTTDFGDLPPLSEENSLRLYRMVQELLSNGLKHAQAKEITLKLYKVKGQVTLSYTDDGMGFDPEQLRGPDGRGGMGLRTLESRATLLGGQLTVESAPQQGTRIRIAFSPNA